MKVAEIKDLVERRPFRPFSVRLNNGARYTFEDSRSGIQSASAAGIATIGMRTTLAHGDLTAAGAVSTAENFDDPELIRLVGKTMNW